MKELILIWDSLSMTDFHALRKLASQSEKTLLSSDGPTGETRLQLNCNAICGQEFLDALRASTIKLPTSTVVDGNEVILDRDLLTKFFNLFK